MDYIGLKVRVLNSQVTQGSGGEAVLIHQRNEFLFGITIISSQKTYGDDNYW